MRALREVTEHDGSQRGGEGSRERELGKMCPGPGPARKRSVEIKEPVRGSWVGLTHKLGHGLSEPSEAL